MSDLFHDIDAFLSRREPDSRPIRAEDLDAIEQILFESALMATCLHACTAVMFEDAKALGMVPEGQEWASQHFLPMTRALLAAHMAVTSARERVAVGEAATWSAFRAPLAEFRLCTRAFVWEAVEARTGIPDAA